MATSFFKKTMVYLGLLDDEYDEYDDYDDRSPRGFAAVSARADARAHEMDEPDDRPPPAPVGRIRTLPREGTAAPQVQTSTVTARPASPSVRPMSPADTAKVQVVAPTRFGDAKEIADCLKGNRPVIVNLQVADRDLQRRMIDFCSGVTYALSGEMEKVADEVFLLAPTNVKVSEEERQRLQERGFGRA
ncbi:MAG TPA: cell division protein SepF [Acidimicrobiales bacterium]|nr:cell division protein SepF [Acidimicrobiales bacterium]